jgi:hypothetical protein
LGKTTTFEKPTSFKVDSKSIVIYSPIHGSVDLKALNAKALAANLMKKGDFGSISMHENTPPVGKIS